MVALNLYRRFNDWLAQAIYILASVIILFIVAALFVSAATRYLTGVGYDWLAELPPQLVPWVVFPLLGVLLRSGSHLAVDVVPHFASPRGAVAIRALVALICLVVAVVFVFAGVQAVGFFKMLNQLSTTELQFPVWWLYVAFPVGFVITANYAFEVFLVEILALAGRDVGRPQPDLVP